MCSESCEEASRARPQNQSAERNTHTHTHNPVSEGLGELTKELICCLPVDEPCPDEGEKCFVRVSKFWWAARCCFP